MRRRDIPKGARKVNLADALDRACYAGRVEHQISLAEERAIDALVEDLRQKGNTEVEVSEDQLFEIEFEGWESEFRQNLSREPDKGRYMRVMVKPVTKK